MSRDQRDDPRVIAAQVLLAVETDDAYVNLLLPARLAKTHLSARDKAFATELTYGTQRLQGRYDWIVSRCLDRPLGQLDPEVRVILRLGVHQLLGMRVPTHAAVSATVDACRSLTHRGGVGLVNAVLRRVAREADEWDARIDAIADDDTRRAVKTSHPRPVVQALRASLAAHGMGDQIDQLLEADNHTPWVTLVARPGLVSLDDLADEVEDTLDVDVAYGQISPWGLIISGGDPARIRSVQRGFAAVEDEGSQLVAGVLASAPLEGDDRRWLDMCAGPGGKTALLAALAGPDVAIDANEVSASRARLVEDSCRAFDTVNVRHGDGTTIDEDPPYDRVLVDAPCTGLGSLRRRPESRFRNRTRQVPELSSLQVRLLSHALACTRVGGLVAYSTCSPHVAETLRVVERARETRETELVDAVALAHDIAPGDHDFGTGPFLQLWPHRDGTDAMFLALMRVVS